jgi:CheY-like chemotaxis protein
MGPSTQVSYALRINFEIRNAAVCFRVGSSCPLLCCQPARGEKSTTGVDSDIAHDDAATLWREIFGAGLRCGTRVALQRDVRTAEFRIVLREGEVMKACRTREQTVVVVEDDPEISEAMELAVSIQGYSVRVASNQAEALELIEATEPNVVLLDYYGVSSNLEDFVRSIRLLHPRVPIVLVTGAKEPRSKAKALGLKECLPKPFDSNELFTLLEKHCGRPARASRAKQVEFSLF